MLKITKNTIEFGNNSIDSTNCLINPFSVLDYSKKRSINHMKPIQDRNKFHRKPSGFNVSNLKLTLFGLIKTYYDNNLFTNEDDNMFVNINNLQDGTNLNLCLMALLSKLTIITNNDKNNILILKKNLLIKLIYILIDNNIPNELIFMTFKYL